MRLVVVGLLADGARVEADLIGVDRDGLSGEVEADRARLGEVAEEPVETIGLRTGEDLCAGVDGVGVDGDGGRLGLRDRGGGGRSRDVIPAPVGDVAARAGDRNDEDQRCEPHCSMLVHARPPRSSCQLFTSQVICSSYGHFVIILTESFMANVFCTLPAVFLSLSFLRAPAGSGRDHLPDLPAFGGGADPRRLFDGHPSWPQKTEPTRFLPSASY